MKRLELLDYGRFIAAIIVVLHHYTYNGIANGKIASITHIPSVVDFTKYGYLGVEFFFMISGFVIFNSAGHSSAAKFSVSRAVRLYPSYWFAILFTSFFAYFWGGELMSVNLKMILVNFSLLQNYVGGGNVDGVYWTLFYEVKFYFLVFILLFFGFQKHLNTVFLLWPLIMLGALLVGFENHTYLGGYYSYFAAGALFALLKDKQKQIAWIPLAIALYLCIHFSVDKITVANNAGDIHRSTYVVAVIVIMFFCFFLAQNTRTVQSISLPFSKLFGALTYPVYLIHAHFGYMVIDKFANEGNKIWLTLLTMLIVVAVAYFIHKVIEIQLKDVWKNLFMATLYQAVNGLKKVGAKSS